MAEDCCVDKWTIHICARIIQTRQSQLRKRLPRLTARFAGVENVNLVQRLNDNVLPENSTVMAEVDTRHRQYRKITLRDTGVLYGQRPCDPRAWYLSPYEFVKH